MEIALIFKTKIVINIHKKLIRAIKDLSTQNRRRDTIKTESRLCMSSNYHRSIDTFIACVQIIVLAKINEKNYFI